MATTAFSFNGGAYTSGLPTGLTLGLTSTTPGGPSPTAPGQRVWTLSGRMNVALKPDNVIMAMYPEAPACPTEE